jgi:hypothetical protein
VMYAHKPPHTDCLCPTISFPSLKPSRLVV